VILDSLELITIYLQMVLTEIQHVTFITFTSPESSSLQMTLPGTSLFSLFPPLSRRKKEGGRRGLKDQHANQCTCDCPPLNFYKLNNKFSGATPTSYFKMSCKY
jgi:hypothetical protein